MNVIYILTIVMVTIVVILMIIVPGSYCSNFV